MKNQRRRLYILCEDDLHRQFVERLADRWGIGPRQRKLKPDNAAGRAVARKIVDRDYTPRRAVDAWTPPAPDEATHVPALTDARDEVRRLGV